MTRMIHGACGGHAFDYDDPQLYEVLKAARVTMPDGRVPAPGEVMLCGSCGERVWTNECGGPDVHPELDEPEIKAEVERIRERLG